MSNQTGLGAGGYEIRPFSQDWPDELKRLRDEVVAVLHKVSPFYTAPPDPTDTALEGKVTDQVAPYGLDENDRHKTIRGAVATVSEQIQSFATSRNHMGLNYITSAPVITMKLDGVMLTGVQAAMGGFGTYLQALADRLAHITEGETREQLQDFLQAQPIDPTTQGLVGQYALVCGLAGRMIDAGNAFLNLDTELRTALTFYAEGRAPKGWWNQLPAPLQSIFSEGAWIAIDELARSGADELARSGASALGPFSAIPVGVTRIVLRIREERERDERKFRRNDVDELLDLADQLVKANDEANKLGSSIDAIVQASRLV